MVCFDECGPIQVVRRGGRSWGPQPVRIPDRYVRHGTRQLFAVFQPHLGEGEGVLYERKRSAEFLDFLNLLDKRWSDTKVHLILDNLSAHRTYEVQKWEYQQEGHFQFHWLPTNSSWLNLIEPWFGVLGLTVLQNSDYQNAEELNDAIQHGIAYLNSLNRPYVWKH